MISAQTGETWARRECERLSEQARCIRLYNRCVTCADALRLINRTTFGTLDCNGAALVRRISDRLYEEYRANLNGIPPHIRQGFDWNLWL